VSAHSAALAAHGGAAAAAWAAGRGWRAASLGKE
jgi:hypothetical protein